MMSFRPPLESAFRTARSAALTRSDMGVAALSSCLWLTQLMSFALALEARTCARATLLLACNLLPLVEGHHWQVCRSRNRCLTLFKVLIFSLLCWEAGRRGDGENSTGTAAAVPFAGDSDPLAREALEACAQSTSPCLHVHGSCPAHGTGSASSAADASSACQPSEEGASSLAPGSLMSASGQLSQLLQPEARGEDEVGVGAWEAAAAAAEPAPAAAEAGRGPRSLLTDLLAESKLFALTHAGLAFRYSSWQHTAALQTALVSAAAAQTAWQDVCGRHGATTQFEVQRVATLMTNLHLLPTEAVAVPPAPLPSAPAVPAAAALNGTSCAGLAAGQSAGKEAAAASSLLFFVPAEVDTCKLVLTWSQLAFGWVLPVWAAALGENYARARFAAQHASQLDGPEQEWSLAASVGYDWMAAAVQLPMLCLILWHLLLAAATAAARSGGARAGGGGG